MSRTKIVLQLLGAAAGSLARTNLENESMYDGPRPFALCEKSGSHITWRVYEGAEDQWVWELRAKRDRLVLRSQQAYTSLDERLGGAQGIVL